MRGEADLAQLLRAGRIDRHERPGRDSDVGAPRRRIVADVVRISLRFDGRDGMQILPLPDLHITAAAVRHDQPSWRSEREPLRFVDTA